MDQAMDSFARRRSPAMISASAAVRALVAAGALALAPCGAQALDARNPGAWDADSPQLAPEQSRAFRAWMVRIVDKQIAAGPTPRWQHRDCAGLVRFAVAEALRAHDEKWQHASGIEGRLPPELDLTEAQKELRHNWKLADGKRAAYVGALELVQENTVLVSRDLNLAQPGDLLFFDQGDDQHLMIWSGRYIAYHTGNASGQDNGLRAVSVPQLMAWRDTRWQPVAHNPNFLGVYRLRFLAR
jgi:uncharacterized protein YfaT (DUF1175 family)